MFLYTGHLHGFERLVAFRKTVGSVGLEQLAGLNVCDGLTSTDDSKHIPFAYSSLQLSGGVFRR